MISFKVDIASAYIMWLISNTLMIIWSAKQKDRSWILVQNVIFLTLTLVGIYNYVYTTID